MRHHPSSDVVTAGLTGRVHAVVGRLSCWPGVVGLLLAYAACVVGFELRERAFGGVRSLDAKFGYGPEQARDFFATLAARDPDLPGLYAWTELTLDMAFPVVYALLLAILIAWLFRSRGRGWALVPFAPAAADVLENLTLAYLALHHDGRAPEVLWGVAAGLSMSKWLLVAGVAAIVLVGAGLRVSSALRARR